MVHESPPHWRIGVSEFLSDRGRCEPSVVAPTVSCLHSSRVFFPVHFLFCPRKVEEHYGFLVKRQLLRRWYPTLCLSHVFCPEPFFVFVPLKGLGTLRFRREPSVVAPTASLFVPLLLSHALSFLVCFLERSRSTTASRPRSTTARTATLNRRSTTSEKRICPSGNVVCTRLLSVRGLPVVAA